MTHVIRTVDDEPRHQLRALYDLAFELSGLRDLDSVLHVALRQCLDLTGSQFGFVGLIGADGHALEIAAIDGFHPSPTFYRAHRVIPLRPNVFANAVLEDRPVRTADARTSPERVGQPSGHPEVVTFLGVPLRLAGIPIGMIGMANRPTPYEDDHEQLTTTYAAQIAILIRNARLNQELETANQHLEQVVATRTRELNRAKDELARKAADLQAVLSETVEAQELERQRISRDLHDSVNQLLIGALLELQSGQRRLDGGQHVAARDALAAAQRILHQVEGELRRVVHDLHPPALDELGLPAALRRLCDDVTSGAGIVSRVTVSGDAVRLGSRCETDLYRISQEALHNVVAHARATRVDVALVFAPDQCRLVVRDDGCGFEPVTAAGPPAGNLGLRSMRQRAERLGGQLLIRSEPGRGTRVIAAVPR